MTLDQTHTEAQRQSPYILSDEEKELVLKGS